MLGKFSADMVVTLDLGSVNCAHCGHDARLHDGCGCHCFGCEAELLWHENGGQSGFVCQDFDF
jgi:hypothetical protein